MATVQGAANKDKTGQVTEVRPIRPYRSKRVLDIVAASRGPADRGAVCRRHRAADQAVEPGAGAVQADAGRQGRQGVHVLQVPQHARGQRRLAAPRVHQALHRGQRRRAQEASGREEDLQDDLRRPGHARRQVPAGAPAWTSCRSL